MPGQVARAVIRAGTCYVIVLDEIDKAGNDFGDPASALLEVLDPEQNSTFNVFPMCPSISPPLFLATATSSSIPLPSDRFEIIELPGTPRKRSRSPATRSIVW